MNEVDKRFAKRKNGIEGLQAAMVAMNPKTGEILAMVGGRDYAKSQLNRATDARRQPGSVFKPFVYAAAISAGGDNLTNPITTATTFIDEPKTFPSSSGPWSPGNYGGNFTMGPITVRDALVQSKNVVTVEVAQMVGLSSVARMAERAGLTKVQQVPSMALGTIEATPLQMASAYTAFANRGRRIAPIAVKRVTTKDGTTLFESRLETKDVMNAQVAYIMTSLMQDVLDRGTGTRVRQMGFNGVAAGKTGSSRDAWFAGYTPNLVCVVYVGFDDNSDIGLTGGVIAAPIWADFMIRALRVRPELGGSFEDPGGLVVCDIDPATGAAPTEETTAPRREIFLAGTEPYGAQPATDGSVAPDGTTGADGQSKPADASGRGLADTTLPPDSRKPEATPDQGWSIGRKLNDFLRGGKPKPSPSPTPTPKPAEESRIQRRQYPDRSQSTTSRATPLKPVVFSSERTTGSKTSTATARPKPPPQVATRPRKVAEREPVAKFIAKPPADSRIATPNKDNPAAKKNNEKKSDQRADTKTVVKREKTSDQTPK
ncbi:MAG TPA: penicillin-binding transpeptidase domain-containing protein, partial [Blastocatellia bacterium]